MMMAATTPTTLPMGALPPRAAQISAAISTTTKSAAAAAAATHPASASDGTPAATVPAAAVTAAARSDAPKSSGGPPPAPALNGRIIFLDVDGVLHPTHGQLFFVAKSMQCLRQIVEQTGAAIVLSSFWQATPAGRMQVNEALKRWGLPPVIAYTVGSTPGSGNMRRALEIAAWVKKQPQLCTRGWVALDDLDLTIVGGPPAFLPILPPGHFVRTNDAVGLTPASVAAAVKLLGGPDASVPPLPPTQANATAPWPRGEGKLNAQGHMVWTTDARYGAGLMQAQQQQLRSNPITGVGYH